MIENSYVRYSIIVISPSGKREALCFNNEEGYYTSKTPEYGELRVYDSIRETISSLRLVSKHWFPTNKGYSFKVNKIIFKSSELNIIIDDSNLFQNV